MRPIDCKGLFSRPGVPLILPALVTASTDNQPATLVLDIGKTNVKVLVMSKQGAVLEVLKTENSSQPAPPYLHLDPSAAWEWLLEAITTLAKSHRIDAIVTTTHGCAAALVDGNDLVLPVMDYEAEPPADVNREFEPLIPAFEETQTPEIGRASCRERV